MMIVLFVNGVVSCVFSYVWLCWCSVIVLVGVKFCFGLFVVVCSVVLCG